MPTKVTNTLMNVGLIIFSPLLFLFIAEIATYGAIHASIFLTGEPKPFLESQTRFDFHPILTQDPLLFSDPFGLDECTVYHPNFGVSNKISTYCRKDGLVDRHGFLRNSLTDRAIDSDSTLVFMVGGSTVEGNGASRVENNFTSLLEKFLKEKYQAIQVVNAGKSGYYAPQEMSLLIHKIAFFEPDLVINISGSNDYSHADRGTIDVKGQEGGFYYLSEPAATIYDHINFRSNSVIHSAISVFQNLRIFLYRFTYTGYLLYNIEKVFSKRMSAPDFVPSHFEEHMRAKKWRDKSVDREFKRQIDVGLASYVRYLQMTKAVLAELDIQHLLVIQPMALWDQHELSESDRMSRDLITAFRFLERGVNSEKRARYFVTRLKDKLESKEINFLDLTGVFFDGAEVYTDGVHYNDLGNKVIAKALAYEIVSRGWLKAQ